MGKSLFCITFLHFYFFFFGVCIDATLHRDGEAGDEERGGDGRGRGYGCGAGALVGQTMIICGMELFGLCRASGYIRNSS